MTDKTTVRNIRRLLKRYRDHIASSHPIEQKAVLWGTPQFEEVEEYIEHQLSVLAEFDLLDHLDNEFSNIDMLYDKAIKAQKRNTENIIDKKLNDATSEPLIENNSGPVKTSQIESTLLLSDLLADYIARNGSNEEWTQKTRDKVASHFEFLIRTVGDIHVALFNEEHFSMYRGALSQRTRRIGGKNKPISKTTKNDHITTVKAIFGEAIIHYAEVTKNYFDQPNVKFKNTKTTKNKRVPFRNDELELLFSTPTYTEGIFRHPYEYWAPLLALFTGSRANEICQLQVDDIVCEDDVYYISHNLNSADKHLKTKEGRIVPIHKKLIELGFIEYVNKMKNPKCRVLNRLGHKMLFKGLSEDKVRGGYQKNLSRWFNGVFDNKTKAHTGYKDLAGVLREDGFKKDFHSFRHTCATGLENVGVSDSIGYKITGHSIGSTEGIQLSSAGKIYRHGADLEVMNDSIQLLNWNEQLCDVRPFFEVCIEKRLWKKRK